MANKEVGIYLINKDMFDKEKTNDEVVEELVNIVKLKDYKSVKIEKEIVDGYKIRLYNRISYSEDTWKYFWKCIDIEDSKTTFNNYLAFIYAGNNIFCITSNKAYIDINRYIVYFYGVCIMSYFIKDEDKIRSAAYSNIMSNFLGGTEFLGEEYQITVDKYWDRINTKLMGELDKNRLYQEFELENKRKKPKVRCDAKDSFTICSKIDINQLIKIIKKLDEISSNELIDKFNTIERIKNEKQIEDLRKKLLKKIYEDYKKDILDICLVHKDIDKFFESMSYTFTYENLYNCAIDTIPNNDNFKEVLSGIPIIELKDMEKIDKVQLICFDGEGKTNLSDNLYAFINTTIEIEGITYLFQNNIWYKLTDNYISNLKDIFESIKIKSEEKDLKFIDWNDEDEGEYINLYSNEENFYKFHPKLEDEIELCDLMYIDRENKIIKMLFLKNGFGANTRDLAIQTVMGTKRFLSILKDKTRLNAIFEKYVKPKNKKYTYEQFSKDVKKFEKNPVIVYKLPKNNTESSNIAKQSIIFARNEIDALGKCRFTMKQL